MAILEIDKDMAKVDLAKAKAQQLAALAWAAQPVNVGGTMVPLCWPGRMHRAIKMLSEANQAGDTAKADQLNKAIDALNAKSHEAWNAAEQAISDYCALTVAAGGTPEDLYPPQCTCDGCKESGKWHRIASSEANLRAALWALLADDGDGDPALIQLVRKANDVKVRDQLWRHLVRIADAMQDYQDAHRQHGEPVKWAAVLR